MPSREEIAVALRFAASTYATYAHQDKNEFWHKKFIETDKLASQVEAMRCDMCEIYDPGTDYATDCCLHPTISISNQGKNFGCFAHEQKKPAG